MKPLALKRKNEFIDSMPGLEQLQMSELFEESKKLCSQSHTEFTKNQQNQITQRLGVLFRTVITKLNSKQRMESKTYVGLLSIFTYLHLSAKFIAHLLSFQTYFYKNMGHRFELVYFHWVMAQETSFQAEAQSVLTTFLFILASFIQTFQKKNKNNVIISLDKIFSKNMVRTLLSMELPDEKKIMRQYRIIINYLFTQQLKKSEVTQAFKSLNFHLLHCESNKNTQVTIIYLLNKAFTFERQKKIDYQIAKVCNKLKQILLSDPKALSNQLIVRLFDRYHEIEPQIFFDFITCKQLLHFLNQQQEYFNDFKKLGVALQWSIRNFNQEDSLELFSAFQKETFTSNLARELLEMSTRNISQILLVKILQSGFWNAILQRYLQIEVSQTQKCQLQKIIQNILSQGVNPTVKSACEDMLLCTESSLHENRPISFELQ